MFKGSVSTVRPPKVLYSGYCAIRSHVRKVSIAICNTTPLPVSAAQVV